MKTRSLRSAARRALCGAAALVLLAAAAGAEPRYPFSFETVEVARGVYAFVEPFGSAIVSGNSIAIVGEAGVLMVDTGQHPRLTRRVIAEIRRIKPKPVLYVVNTHWHNDHVAGNAIYAEAFPEAKFIAHEFTARMLESDVKPYAGAQCANYLRSQTAELRDMLASNQRPTGEPLTADQRARLEGMLIEADFGIEECSQFAYRGADLAIGDSLRVQLGGREVRILWLGRANTAGDVLVHVPDVGVLATGDIVVHPFPFATHSYLSEWAQALRKIEAFDAPILIPGHGPVMRDRTYVTALAELFESVMAQARAAYRPGIDASELRKAIDVSQLRERIAGSDRVIGANFDEMVLGSGVDRALQELRGEFKPEAMPRE